MAGLIDMIRTGQIPAGSNVLYAHLGGPAIHFGCASGWRGIAVSDLR